VSGTVSGIDTLVGSRPPRLAHQPLRAIGVASVQGTLALDLSPRQDPPDTGSVAGRVGADVVDIDRAARREFERFSGRIVQAVVEIVGGDRPLSQVLRWTTTPVYQDLGRRAQLVARAVDRRPGQGGIQGTRPQVVGLRTCFVSPGIAEVSAHVRYGLRSRAVAARFERQRERWVCVALEFA
jgi:Family of unknown function (DUF6459)